MEALKVGAESERPLTWLRKAVPASQQSRCEAVWKDFEDQFSKVYDTQVRRLTSGTERITPHRSWPKPSRQALFAST